MNIVELAINKVIIDSSLQPRVGGIDADHVQELQDVLDNCPPIRVVKRGDDYVLVDGFHRFAAAQNIGREHIAAEILDAKAEDDLFALAFSLNAAHGRPLTLSDRRAYAARLLRENPSQSDREVGRCCGLVQPTIAKIRQELEQKAHIPVTTERVGRDGQTYPASPKPQAKPSSLIEVINNILPSSQRIKQRRIADYLWKLADALEEQDKLKGFETFDNAAMACRAVLGDDAAAELAARLGWSSRNIFEIAKLLGFNEEAQR